MPNARSRREVRSDSGRRSPATLLGFQFDFENMDLAELGIQDASHLHLLAFKAMNKIRPVKAVNVLPCREDEIAAEIVDAIHSASIGRATHGLGLEHLLMRPRER